MSEEPGTYTTQADSGVMRVEHNRENPYTMIHHDVLENAA